MWDLFICHASEDKTTFVHDLALELTKRGVNVWYDEFSLKMGDSLRRSIDRGLAESRFGAVVLSPAFFGKGWPERELNGLTSRDVDAKGGIILPIWHNVGFDEVNSYSPPLADKVAAKSSEGVAAVCDKILAVLRPTPSPTAMAAPVPAPSGVTPYTLATLSAFARRFAAGFDWTPNLPTIYASHRQLALVTVEQLEEALADAASQKSVDEFYSRLLGRPADPVGSIIYAPWIFLLGEQGQRAVEASIMSSPEYRTRKARNRVGIQSPPPDFIPDPMTMGPSLPADWDGDAWIKPDHSEYFVRAWNKTTGRTAIGRGPTYPAAREQLVHDVQHGDSRASLRIT